MKKLSLERLDCGLLSISRSTRLVGYVGRILSLGVAGTNVSPFLTVLKRSSFPPITL